MDPFSSSVLPPFSCGTLRYDFDAWDIYIEQLILIDVTIDKWMESNAMCWTVDEGLTSLPVVLSLGRRRCAS